MILIHPEAAAEARAARLWYAERDHAVGRRFQAEYDRAIQRVDDHPDRWPPYPHLTGNFYSCRFRRFPYAIIYERFADVTHVLAVAADKRRPGYWAHRE